MSAGQVIALVVLGVLYLVFCAYWWRGGRPLQSSRERRDGDDRA